MKTIAIAKQYQQLIVITETKSVTLGTNGLKRPTDTTSTTGVSDNLFE